MRAISTTEFGDGHIIAVSYFEDVVSEANKCNQGISVSVPETTYEWSFGKIHSKIELLKCPLHLINHIGR